MTEMFCRKDIITKNEWFDILDNIDGSGLSYEEIKDTLINKIKKRIQFEEVGVMFSGGVDSTLIAKVLIDELGKEKVTLVTVGCYDKGRKMPEDVDEAKKVAQEMGTTTNVILADEKKMEETFNKTVKLMDEDIINAVNISVAAVEVLAYEFLREKGIKQVFAGLGSEEVFAGYQRHENSDDLNKLTKQSLQEMYDRDLRREVILSKHYKIIASTPFMDKSLINNVFGISKELKIGKDNKMAVRRIAEDLKLSNAYRKKRAAQYGSRTQSYLEKICKKKGFNLIKDCLAQWK